MNRTLLSLAKWSCIVSGAVQLTSFVLGNHNILYTIWIPFIGLIWCGYKEVTQPNEDDIPLLGSDSQLHLF